MERGEKVKSRGHSLAPIGFILTLESWTIEAGRFIWFLEP
jgi:hypothetical protein